MAPERPGSEDERCGNSVVLHANRITVPIVHQSAIFTGDLLKEGDGATKVFAEVRVGSATTEDDDLTPLSWLQDRNLLKGIPLRGGPMCPGGPGGEARAHHAVSEETAAQRANSPTSDYAEDSSDHPESISSSCPPSSPVPVVAQIPKSVSSENFETSQQNSPANIIPYNPKIHVTSKPPYSFSCLIFMAIEDSTQRALPVKDIYAWILDHFPYFQGAPTGWKNSVRHNLSLNKCFKKVDKSPNVGKGSLWMVDPMFRPNLLQALRKAPYHPYLQVDRNASMNSALPADSGSIPNGKTASGSSSSSSSDYTVPVLLNTPAPLTPGRSNLPNPVLFPFLSRRLAAAGLGLPPPDATAQRPAPPQEEEEEEEDSDSREDVDAATAMLALKHGPRILMPRHDEWYKRPREKGHGAVPTLDTNKSSKRNHSMITLQGTVKSMVITSSPSEDHTYSAGSTSTSPSNGTRLTLSPDEAFGEGSASSTESSPEKLCDSGAEEEEQRKIAEGADALLNLAGICTSGRGTKRSSNSSVPGVRQSKRQCIDKPGQTKRQPQPHAARMWKKASLHQGSRAKKSKSKDKSSRHRR